MENVDSKIQELRNIDLVIEGYDQHQAWFLNSFIVASALRNRNPPFRAIKTHGLLLDNEGRKMSKSLGNVINPIDLIQGSLKMNGERKYGVGVEVLRIWTALQDQQIDIPLHHKDLEIYSQKLKNIRKILKLSLKMYQQAEENTQNPGIIDCIFVSLVTNQLQNLKKAFEEYNFKRAVELIFELFDQHLLDFYLRSKQNQRNLTLPLFQQTLRGILIGISPILSFTAEQIHSQIFEESVFQQQWPQLPLPQFKYSVSIIEILMKLRSKIIQRLKYLQDSGIVKHKEDRVELVFINSSQEQDEVIILEQLEEELGQFFGFNKVKLISKSEAEEQNKSIKILKKGRMFYKIGTSKSEVTIAQLRFQFQIRLTNQKASSIEV